MKRRSKAGSEPVGEVPRRKALKPKRDAPKAIAHSDLSNAGQEIAVARLTRELNEALEQQTAKQGAVSPASLILRFPRRTSTVRSKSSSFAMFPALLTTC